MDTPACPDGPDVVLPSYIAEMVAAYESGLSALAVGAEFGHAEADTRKLLRAAGVTIRPPRPVKAIPPERDVLMAVAYASGLSVREIGPLMNPPVAHSTVHRRLQRMGVAIRPFDPKRPRKKRPIPPAKLGAVIEAWVSGAPMDSTGVWPARLKRVMAELGLADRRPGPVRGEDGRVYDWGEIYRLVRVDGLSREEVAARLGCCQATVSRVVKLMDAERERAEAAREP